MTFFDTIDWGRLPDVLRFERESPIDFLLGALPLLRALFPAYLHAPSEDDDATHYLRRSLLTFLLLRE